MRRPRINTFRRFALAAAVLAALASRAAADPLAHLPRYNLVISFDTKQHVTQVCERVTWTNPTRHPTSRLAFNFYPHYRVPEGDYVLFAKMLELLRQQPSQGIDRGGRHGVVNAAKLISATGDQPLTFEFDRENPTALWVNLPRPVAPGEAVTVELACTVHLPNKQGRWGHWEGVTFFSNALPLLAFCDDRGWRPMPYVPWTQPWYNEAGVFTATITLPADQKLACPAVIKSDVLLDSGCKRVETEPFVGRDFSLLCSARYREFCGEATSCDGKRVALKVLAFPEHEFYANEMLKIVAEAIPVFSKWFGPFPYPQFTVAESFFGWNGNECAGLVMIDERVFGSPHLARGYVEYLVSHEVCHQWWYNLVGTNGYCEPFVDEGAAVHFTHKMLDARGARSQSFMEWPDGLKWLPNIHRENYRYSGVANAVRFNDVHPAAQELPKYGNVIGLFNGAYDRGSKVYRMIEDQLGEAAFFDFIRTLVAKYSWRILHAADLRRELEAYTGRDWGQFFDRWVYGKGLTDWAVEGVTEDERPLASASTRPAARRLTVTLAQKRELTEPTTLGLRFGEQEGFPVRIPINPSPKPYRVTVPGAGGFDMDVTVETLSDKSVRVSFDNAPVLSQVAVDPDGVLMDANPANNLWKAEPRFRLTPLYTMLDETELANDYQRWNFGAGPWFSGPLYQDPWYTRSTMVGLRAGAFRSQSFVGGMYAVYRTDFRDIVLGADAAFKYENYELGFNYERRIDGPYGSGNYGESAPNRAFAYLRNIRKQSSSLYLYPVLYDEGFVAYQDNFLPFARTAGGERPENTVLAGYHVRFNMYTPYWDPEGGVWADFMAGGGAAKFRDGTDALGQIRAELAGVKQLPEGFGPLSKARVAARGLWMGATPDKGQFFALGGGTQFRGFDLAERQGSMLWVGSVELRYPLAQGVKWDVLDHVVGARTLWLAGFYDVGAVYANGHSVGGVAHAVGAGLRVDLSFFSFIERATLRFDVAKTVNAATPFQFWFGVQHAF